MQPAGVILAAMTPGPDHRDDATTYRLWVLIVFLGASMLGRSLAAQNPPPRAPGAPPPVARAGFDTSSTTIPFFPLGSSPLELRGDARPGMYLAAVGRRAIAMGTEDGRLLIPYHVIGRVPSVSGRSRSAGEQGSFDPTA
jgi:hypothetical protein